MPELCGRPTSDFIGTGCSNGGIAVEVAQSAEMYVRAVTGGRRLRGRTMLRQDVAVEFPAISGWGHIDLTVTDVKRSARWWQEVMGFTLVATRERPDFTLWNVRHPSGLVVGLMTHSTLVTDIFDERVVGLDHFAFQVPNRTALDAWVEHLDRLGIANSGVREERGGPLIVLRDPDNIQIELWAFDPTYVMDEQSIQDARRARRALRANRDSRPKRPRRSADRQLCRVSGAMAGVLWSGSCGVEAPGSGYAFEGVFARVAEADVRTDD